MELRRVVVAGMGAVTPLGCGVEASWANILASKSGAQRIDDFQVDDIACQIAHRVRRRLAERIKTDARLAPLRDLRWFAA